MEILDLKSTVTDFLKEFLMVATMKSSTVQSFLKKKKLQYDPTVPLLNIYLREVKSQSSRNTCTSMFIEAFFIIAKIWRQPVSIN